MDSNDKTYLDIDELARKIEERIRELDKKQEKVVEEKEEDLNKIIEDINKRISELDYEKEEDFDVEDLMDKINAKLAMDDDSSDDSGVEKYDLDDIIKAINDTIKALEAKKKKKKAQKAKYCDLARKKAYDSRKKKKK